MQVDWSEQRLLIVAPHPDDEVIGCGGLINRVKREHGEVFVQFMTVGDTVDFSAAGRSTVGERTHEIKQVAEYLGFDDYHIAFSGDEYHLRLDLLPQVALVSLLERTSPLSITALRPSVVLFPQLTSYNQDHRAAAQATMTALRPAAQALKHQPDVVLVYEHVADQWNTVSASPPNTFVGLTEADVGTKMAALSLYASQCRESPNPRCDQALRSLAGFRGGQSGFDFAEAFHCVRWRI